MYIHELHTAIFDLITTIEVVKKFHPHVFLITIAY